jgi:hypothetical protein
MNGTLSFIPTQFSIPTLLCIALGWPKRHVWHSLPICYNLCKFCRNPSVMKGNLVQRLEQFLVHISPRIAEGWPKCHTWHSFPMCYKQCKFVRKGKVMKGTLLLMLKQFSVPTSISIVGVTETSHLTLPTHVLQAVQFGQHRSLLTSILLEGWKSFFVPLLHRIAAGWMKHRNWHTLPMRYKQCKFGRNLSVMKGTLLLMSK